MSIDTINQHLAEMRAAGKVQDIRTKGEQGEAAVLDVIHDYCARHGGFLRHGFMYPYATNRQSILYLGNIFWDKEQKRYYDMTSQVNDEIDVLYVSPYRIFVIEVKSYHTSTLVVTDDWMERDGERVDKSPYAQAEKHARHLYHSLYDVIPNGDARYIIPMVCFVDRCSGNDDRSPEMRHYIPTATLNTLRRTIADRDTLVDSENGYTLDLNMIERKLKSIETERTI